ncbi:unnamed protein product [Aspergillus niger]|uniref:Contig An04c0400, genomic contig n=1 Tax=Aspergillus niger (strain ATCC MYA-4892 / CBS 513.88 / FGSC A1513) TaxID=425011 RepID=A2QKE2_ASPNC|nr:unnamed protein product [Aspergillus niger]
MHIILTSEEA